MLSAAQLQRKREKKAARRREVKAMKNRIVNAGGKPFDVEKRFQRAKLEKHIRRIKRRIKAAK